MHPVKKLFYVAAGLFVLAGCAHTRVYSLKKNLGSKQQFGVVLVVAGCQDLGSRTVAEDALAEHLRYYGVKPLEASRVFFPGRELTKDDFRKVLADSAVDAILVLQPLTSGQKPVYMPPTYYTQGSAWIAGNQISGSSTTSQSGGYTMHLPWASFSAELIEVSSETVVWIASAESGGNAVASPHTLLRSASGQVVNHLASDKLLK